MVKGNLKIVDCLSEHGGKYSDYLVMPASLDEIERLADEDDWEKIDELCSLYNDTRLEAMSLSFLRGNKKKLARLPGILSTLRTFFYFVEQLHQEIHLNEDIEFLHENFKPIMHKFIFKHSDVDLELMNEVYEALLTYYSFLSDKKIVSNRQYNLFEKDIMDMKDELIHKMIRYNETRHDDRISESKKESIRGELFEGDYVWPHL